MKLHFLVAVALFFTFQANSQSTLILSDQAEISVLTVGPGKVLNDAFGHNGFRIKDPVNRRDLVFNYGVYDFDTPNFYLKFAQGKLNYRMGLNNYEEFYKQYVYQNRSIEEQVLNLSQDEKQRMFEFLVENYKPKNRYYLYDFFFDNCATRIRDVVEKNLNGDLEFRTQTEFETQSFRDLIYEHVPKNSWGSFGIDLALGSVIDKEALAYEHMYLPKYIAVFFDHATIKNGKDLVKEKHVLYQPKEESESNGFLWSPAVILGILSLIIIYFTYRDRKKKKRTKILDNLIFLFTGLAGLVMLLLWFATDHEATAFNYNLLWAFPFNLILLLALNRKIVKKWVIPYLKFLLIMLALMAMHWMIGVQVYAFSLIPILIALVLRYLFLIRLLRLTPTAP